MVNARERKPKQKKKTSEEDNLQHLLRMVLGQILQNAQEINCDGVYNMQLSCEFCEKLCHD